MIKVVLLDLDDTLLDNPTQPFIEQYMGLLVTTLREQLGLDQIGRAMMAATQAVLSSCDPIKTNRDTFYEAFLPSLTVERDAFDRVVDTFYRAVYPQVQAVTTRRPDARPLVDWLIAQEYAVVVATNPFMPRTAVEQRLAWAGVPVDEVPFKLVTTLDNMRFTKPHPQYFEEILARIGLQADEAIMVGDDWQNDIIPAWRAGLNTFWITGDDARPDPAQTIQPDGYGSLHAFARRVQDENWLETLVPRPLESAQIVPRLSGNMAALLDAASEIPGTFWHMRPDVNEWTPVEVLCHLVDSEREVQRPRLQTICREDNPFLSAPHPPPGPATRTCPVDGWQVALTFAAERQKTLDFLNGLDASAWDRPARHSIFGPTSLLEMANFTAQHDRLHITQLCQTVGKCE
ncbi:MAG: HAD-IA family hydrolase [Anaerolineae bacterium]|nr:HAD-IA family hydrolase [Anaerolineae bacterium]